MNVFGLTTLEALFNRYLNLDPDSKMRLAVLNDKWVAVDLVGLDFSFQIHFGENRFWLKPADTHTPDVRISGTPLNLLRMVATNEDRKQFFSECVKMEGDLTVAQHVIDLADQLNIDWEEYASHWLGDFSAHQLGRFVSKLKKIKEQTRKVLLQNTNEYMHEEINLAPSVEALNDFFLEVDELRMDVDRMEARLNQIRQSLVKRGVE